LSKPCSFLSCQILSVLYPLLSKNMHYYSFYRVDLNVSRSRSRHASWTTSMKLPRSFLKRLVSQTTCLLWFFLYRRAMVCGPVMTILELFGSVTSMSQRHCGTFTVRSAQMTWSWGSRPPKAVNHM